MSEGKEAFLAAYGSEKYLDKIFNRHPSSFLNPESVDTIGELQENALNNPALKRRHLENALTSPSHQLRVIALEHQNSTEQDLIRGMSDPVRWVRDAALRTHAERRMANSH